MHTSDDLEVLVIGAGPIGLALACQLRQLGRTGRIIDKLAGPSTTSKAIGLQYRVSEVRARMGIVGQGIQHLWEANFNRKNKAFSGINSTQPLGVWSIRCVFARRVGFMHLGLQRLMSWRFRNDLAD